MRCGALDFRRIAIAQISKRDARCVPFFILWNLPKGLFGEYFDVEVFKNSGRKPSEGFFKKIVRHLLKSQIDILPGFPYYLK